ncbi:MAG: sulfur carrier protein ThiS [Treponema sp.]|jgi:sulfur carrier protein|nr:sulfur carrier protein ThiS [Treponema sp.]
MYITVNGKASEVSGELNIDQLLVEVKAEMPDYVTVQLNGEILKRDAFGHTTVKEGAVVEFLYYMGGGTC